MQENYSDSQLLEAIQKGGQHLNQAMHYLYRESGVKDSILSLIRRRNGNTQDGEDVFQEGIRHLIMNVRTGKFKEKSSVKTYLTVICRNLWHTHFQRKVKLETIKQVTIPTAPNQTPSPEGLFLMRERAELLQNVLAQLGSACKKVLGLWSLGYSFKEIGEQMGKSETAMRKKKYDCFQRLMSMLKDQPNLVKELLS